jgi:L-lysine 2,3-aminomutase
MIAATSPASQFETASARPRWQHVLADAVTDAAELLRLLGLDPDLTGPAREAGKQFPLRVPRNFAARMRRGDPKDPLLLQVLPLGAELVSTDGYLADPVGDLARRAAPGLLHKYEGRALLVATAPAPCIAATAFAGIFLIPSNRHCTAAGRPRSSTCGPTRPSKS